jgi:hypothetical protein
MTQGGASDRVIFQSAPVPRRGSAVGFFLAQGTRTLPPWPNVMTPKSTMYNAEPSGENRAAMGRSNPPPPTLEAGPLLHPRLTAKSSTTPFSTLTRTTLKPTGANTLPEAGD